MRVFITGIDGYEGFALAQHLAERGHLVTGIDSQYRRIWVRNAGGDSVLPIGTWDERVEVALGCFDPAILMWEGDTCSLPDLMHHVERAEPDVVVHMAEQPSAPYSMIDARTAGTTLQNNILGTSNLLHALHTHCPEAHLIYISTMGEYGTPQIPIPDGYFGENEPNGSGDFAGLPAPKLPGSFYHASKVASSTLVDLAARIWGLSAMILFQGVVYGTMGAGAETDPRLLGRLDVDEQFGTVANRFCAQAVLGEPLSVYGKGGQTRGFISLQETCASILALCEGPHAQGVRGINQITRLISVNDLAEAVRRVGEAKGLTVIVEHVPNPREEAEEHFYQPSVAALEEVNFPRDLGLELGIEETITALMQHQTRLADIASSIAAKTQWDNRKGGK